MWLQLANAINRFRFYLFRVHLSHLTVVLCSLRGLMESSPGTICKADLCKPVLLLLLLLFFSTLGSIDPEG